jgi:hypothetical protein
MIMPGKPSFLVNELASIKSTLDRDFGRESTKPRVDRDAEYVRFNQNWLKIKHKLMRRVR